MFLITVGIAAVFFYGVEAVRVPRGTENIDNHTAKISSAVVKAIIIGSILFVCAFLLLYAYWTCIAHSSPPSPHLQVTTRSFALPIAAAVQFSRSGPFTPSAVGVASTSVSVPGKTYTVKTKITPPTAGAKALSIRQIPSN